MADGGALCLRPCRAGLRHLTPLSTVPTLPPFSDPKNPCRPPHRSPTRLPAGLSPLRSRCWGSGCWCSWAGWGGRSSRGFIRNAIRCRRRCRCSRGCRRRSGCVRISRRTLFPPRWMNRRCPRWASCGLRGRWPGRCRCLRVWRNRLENLDRFRAELKQGCHRHQIALVPMVTDQPYAEALAQYLTLRMRR